LGFTQEGFKVVFSIDIDKGACETYSHNLGDIICGDIMDEYDIPEAPLVIGGSKCQRYSNSNRKNNYGDNPDDPLLKRYIEIVQKNRKAKVFVYENVPQFLSARDGISLKYFKKSLPDFEITSGIVPAAAYGSCQIRERAIIIGSKIGKIDIPKGESTPDKYKTVREAFSGITKDTPNQRDYTVPKKETLERFKYLSPGNNVHNIPEDKRPKSTHSCSYRRLEWDKPSPTLPNVRKALILHPEEDRILSIREIARTLGVPDWYEFMGSLSSKQQQLANAVDVGLSNIIARAVKKAIEAFNQRTCCVSTC